MLNSWLLWAKWWQVDITLGSYTSGWLLFKHMLNRFSAFLIYYILHEVHSMKHIKYLLWQLSLWYIIKYFLFAQLKNAEVFLTCLQHIVFFCCNMGNISLFCWYMWFVCLFPIKIMELFLLGRSRLNIKILQKFLPSDLFWKKLAQKAFQLRMVLLFVSGRYFGMFVSFSICDP